MNSEYSRKSYNTFHVFDPNGKEVQFNLAEQLIKQYGEGRYTVVSGTITRKWLLRGTCIVANLAINDTAGSWIANDLSGKNISKLTTDFNLNEEEINRRVRLIAFE